MTPDQQNTPYRYALMEAKLRENPCRFEFSKPCASLNACFLSARPSDGLSAPIKR